jgi:predicted nuclease of predicted toxin-antitoxin system
LVDASLSPKVAEGLRQAGFDALHVEDLDLLTATDGEIFDRSVEDQFVVVTADTSRSSRPTTTSRCSSPTCRRSRGTSSMARSRP